MTKCPRGETRADWMAWAIFFVSGAGLGAFLAYYGLRDSSDLLHFRRFPVHSSWLEPDLFAYWVWGGAMFLGSVSAGLSDHRWLGSFWMGTANRHSPRSIRLCVYLGLFGLALLSVAVAANRLR